MFLFHANFFYPSPFPFNWVGLKSCLPSVKERVDKKTQIFVESEIDLEDDNKVSLLKGTLGKVMLMFLLIGIVLACFIENPLHLQPHRPLCGHVHL